MAKSSVDEGPGNTTVPPVKLPEGKEILQKLDELMKMVLALQTSVDALAATVNNIES